MRIEDFGSNNVTVACDDGSAAMNRPGHSKVRAPCPRHDNHGKTIDRQQYDDAASQRLRMCTSYQVTIS